MTKKTKKAQNWSFCACNNNEKKSIYNLQFPLDKN